MILYQELSNKRSTLTSILISLKIKTHIGHGRFYNKFASRLSKMLYILYLRSYSTIFILQSYLNTKKSNYNLC